MTRPRRWTEEERDVIDLALTHLRRHYEQLARAFRQEPICEDIAHSYDELAAQAAAVRARILVEAP